MRTYTTIDKDGWGPGPWQGEPDKVQWVDDATGLDCLIVRAGNAGHLCGYVGVPPDHPWHSLDYSVCVKGDGCDADPDDYWCRHSPEVLTDVHGGLTFAGGCRESDDPSTGICHVPEPGRPDDVWWFGFDCAHLGDRSPGYERMFGDGGSYKDFRYVQAEVRLLAKQLAEVPA